MEILFLGNKNRGVVCLDALLSRGDEIVGIVTPPEDEIGDWYPSLAEHGKNKGIPIFQPTDINDQEFVFRIAELSPDLIVMAGYNQILHESILSIPEKGTINLHGGKLPDYRGASTLNWMIINGESEGGVAIHFVDEKIDTGDIIVQERFPIEVDDTIMDLIERTDEIFRDLITAVVQDIENGVVERTSQHPSEGSYYHSRRPEDGRIRWSEYTAKEVHDLVRALCGPYPSAFTRLKGEKIEINDTSLMDEDIRGVPGRICLRRPSGVVAIASDRGLIIKTVTTSTQGNVPANRFFSELGGNVG